jgi:CubicO group peptidase (beta-lactamase class C family)
MNRAATLLLLSVVTGNAGAQPSYFPPTTGTNWETTMPATFDWCQPRIDSLYAFLNTNNTKAFVLLVDGRIVLEQYFNGHTQNLPWYWASAGKTLTAFVTGIAQQEGYLQLTDPTSDFLGEGWTSCTPEQEAAITVWHQLTMTSGLNDGVSDPNCFSPECLQYLAPAGDRWAYHNAPYTLLDGVIEAATGTTLNQYTTQKVKNPTGMTGQFIQSGNFNVFWSNARSMARFGLLLQNNGNWNGNQIMTDSDYFNQMTNTSQDLNKSYGYLTWLNGKPSFMVPGLQLQFPGPLMPNAPADCYMALGKDGQLLNVIPSLNMVWVRMGQSPSDVTVDFLLNDIIWQYINLLACEMPVSERYVDETKLCAYPNPFSTTITLAGISPDTQLQVVDASLRILRFGPASDITDLRDLKPGIYFIRSTADGQCVKILKDN